MKNQSILIRAQQIRDQHTGRVPLRDVAKQLYSELGAAKDELAIDAIVTILTAVPSPQILPEPTPALFEMKEWVRVPGKDGDEYVEGNALTTDEVETVLNRERRTHKTQLLRADRALEDVARVKSWDDFNPALPYNENVRRFKATLPPVTRRALELSDDE